METSKEVLDALRADAEQREIESSMDLSTVKGTIKWFNASKGYGLIKPDNRLPDILLHSVCLRGGGYKIPKAGDRVECLVLRRPRGPQAFRILKLTPAH